jgi:tetratricopeptide (TPR) repeat protein
MASSRLLTAWLVPVALLSSEILLAHGSVHERLAVVERKLAESPEDAALLLQRAGLFHEHGDEDKALADLRTVGRLDPGRVERWDLEARIHLRAGKPDLALKSIGRLLDVRPESVEGLALRSGILEELGRHREAIADARQVLALADAPTPPQHLRLIGLLERHGDHAEVEKAFTAARESVGDFPVLLRRHAEWLAEKGDRERAAAVYAELREKVPGLAFSVHVEEVRLWLGHDDTRAREAREKAERSWRALSPATRAREGVLAKYRELEQLAGQLPD